MTVERSPFFNFGISDMRIVSRTDKTSVSHLRVLGDVGGEFTADTTEVSGGALNYPYAVSITGFKGSLKVNAKEYDPDTQAKAAGGVSTFSTAAPNGEVTDSANVTGTTLMSAAGFITPIIKVADVTWVKGGWYLAVAASATTINVYAMNSSMFTRGPSADYLSYVDKSGLVNASPLTIPSDPNATLDMDTIGITMTRGASARSVTSGDSMIFYVKPTFVEANKMVFGSANASFTNVMVYLASEMEGGQTTFAILYNCKCLGAPIPFKRKGYAEYDYTIMPMYDSALDAVGEIRTIREAW